MGAQMCGSRHAALDAPRLDKDEDSPTFLVLDKDEDAPRLVVVERGANKDDAGYVSLPDGPRSDTEERKSVAFNRGMALDVCIVIGYLVVGCIYYHVTLGWDAVDTIYFSVTIITTVGYGDQTIDGGGNGVLIFTACYVMVAMLLVAVVASRIVNVIVASAATSLKNRQEQAQQDAAKAMLQSIAGPPSANKGFPNNPSHTSTGLDLLDATEQSRDEYRKLVWSVLAYLFWILFGTLYFGYRLKDDTPDDENPWVRSCYFSIITLCTVGFGDVHPITDEEKIVDTIFMLVGVPIFGNALARMSALVHPEDYSQEDVKLSFVQGLSADRFKEFQEFEEDFDAVCKLNDNVVDGTISQLEFVSFILVKNGLVNKYVLADIIRNFNELDTDGSGVLSEDDFLKNRNIIE